MNELYIKKQKIDKCNDIERKVFISYEPVTAQDVQEWCNENGHEFDKDSGISDALYDKISKIANNANFCTFALLDDLTEWLCANGCQDSGFRQQIEKYKAYREELELKK